MTVIDINIDAGESYGAWRMGDDAGTFPYATSVNLACGFHGGDPASMFAARMPNRSCARPRPISPGWTNSSPTWSSAPSL